MTKSTSELFEFNKMLFIYASTVFIVFFWLLKMIINKKIILKKTPLDIPIVIFFLSQLVSTFFSIDIHTSIFGYYGRFNGGLLSIMSYITLYYGLISNEVKIENLLKAIVYSSSIVIFWAIPGHFGYDLTCFLFTGKLDNSCWDNSSLAFRPELRAFSTLGQPNWLGAYLVVAFFIGVYYLVKNIVNKNVETQNFASLRLQIITSIFLFLNFSMILMSRSRSAIGAVIVGLILFVGYYLLFIKANYKKLLITLLLVTIVPILLFKTGIDKFDKYLDFKNLSSIIYPQKTIINRPSSIIQSNNVTESFDIRKIVWEGAWKLAIKYPLFGTGVETFAYSYYLVRPVSHNLTSEWDYVYNKAHNEYFNYLATTGFIGLGSYLILILFFIFYVLKISNFKFLISNQFQILKSKFFKNAKLDIGNSLKIKNLKLKIEENQNERYLLIITLLIAYVTILITNFFGFSTTTIQLFFFLIPAFIYSITDLTIGSTQRSTPTTLNKLQKFLILVTTSLAIYLLFLTCTYYLADIYYSYGLKYSRINDQQKAAAYFENALKIRQEPVYLDRLSSSLAYLSAVASIQNQRELAKQAVSLSDTYNRKTILDYPKNVFYWKTRAKNMYYFYQVTGSKSELLQGIAALRSAQLLSPTDPKIPYSIALYASMVFDEEKNSLDKQKWQILSLEEIGKIVKLKPNYKEGFILQDQLMKKYGLIKE